MIERDTVVRLVAIAGGTCAGKTTLAQALLDRFPRKINILSADSFYYDRSGVSEEELKSVEWESRDSIEVDYFLKILEQLIIGEPCAIPSYDPISHARLNSLRLAEPAPIVVVEGLHVISIVRDLAARQYASYRPPATLLKLFIDCPERTRYMRRKRREAIAASIPGEFDTYWKLVCQPFYLTEVLRQRDEADLVVGSPLESVEMERIIEWVETPGYQPQIRLPSRGDDQQDRLSRLQFSAVRGHPDSYGNPSDRK